MARVIVCKLEETVKRKLARHGRSMEEEVREILRDVLKDEGRDEMGLGTRIARRFKGMGFDGEIPELRGYVVKPPDLD
jgi:antitoxin FitA